MQTLRLCVCLHRINIIVLLDYHSRQTVALHRQVSVALGTNSGHRAFGEIGGL